MLKFVTHTMLTSTMGFTLFLIKTGALWLGFADGEVSGMLVQEQMAQAR